MQVLDLTREFKYNGVKLADPNPQLGPEQVKEFYASQYPELLNAVVEGPVTKNGVAAYSFTRAAGAKGAARKSSAQEIIQSTLADPDATKTDVLVTSAMEGRHARAAAPIAHVAVDRNTALPLTLPRQAFGLWG